MGSLGPGPRAPSRRCVDGESSVTVATLPEAQAARPQASAAAQQGRILFYLIALLLLLGFGAPTGSGLIGLPLKFILKNKLHLKAHEMATFTLAAGVPTYLAFLFGFARDTFNPFGMRDRGFLILFGGICAGVYLLFALAPVEAESLLLANLILGAVFLFVISAERGLISQIGQQKQMTGQVSAARGIFVALPAIVAILAGGALSDLLEGASAVTAAHILFLTGAAVMASVVLFGFWRPASVFDHLTDDRPPGASRLADIKRLARHWPIYPALLIWLMWEFSPGGDTPLMYYFQNTLGARDSQWGEWHAVVYADFIPTYLAFGLLCRRFPLRTLLVWGTLLGIPQYVPFLFVHSIPGAFVAAIVVGLTGGIASAAYTDLMIRSCPRGLQGTMLMMSVSLSAIVHAVGNVLGTNLYERFGGFTACVIAITTVYALILPALRFVPKRLTATADGQAPEVAFGADQGSARRDLHTVSPATDR